MTVCFRMPPVAIPWKLRDLHTSILSNNLHSGEINKYFWKFCLHLLMSKFYHWLVYMVFTMILKYYLSWWKRRHLCCWVKSLVATLQIMAEWPVKGSRSCFPDNFSLSGHFFSARQMRVCYRITSLLRDPSTSENLLSCWYAVNM